MSQVPLWEKPVAISFCKSCFTFYTRVNELLYLIFRIPRGDIKKEIIIQSNLLPTNHSFTMESFSTMLYWIYDSKNTLVSVHRNNSRSGEAPTTVSCWYKQHDIRRCCCCCLSSRQTSVVQWQIPYKRRHSYTGKITGWLWCLTITIIFSWPPVTLCHFLNCLN